MPTTVYPIYPQGAYATGAYPTGTGYYANPNLSTWQSWVTIEATITGTSVTAWPAWLGNDMGTGGTNVIAQTSINQLTNVWINWNNNYLPPAVPAAPPSPEHTARNALIVQNRNRAHRLRRKQAERRAEILLLSNLTDEQRREWAAEKAFHVETADGRRRYRIKLGLAGNVSLVKCEGEPPTSRHGRPLRPGNRFCAHVYHPEGWIPDADNCLAQALLLQSEGGEEEFLAMANVS